MEDLKNLAKTLLKYRSYKERHDLLSASIDRLSFDYPELYSLFSREMKRREIEANDPNKISKWINSSNSHLKLHESLILVKNNNILAKEAYLDSLKCMLFQTIENGSNIDETLKICRLIEKSVHLKSIYEQLECYIQQIYKIYDNNQNAPFKRQSKYSRSDYVNQILVDPYKSLKIQSHQSQHIPVWPTMLHPSYVSPLNCLPNLNLDYFGNKYPTYDNQASFFNLTIVDQDMDGAFAKWLHYLKLHKYQWFFNSLSYLEIECIDEDNFEAFVSKVNKNSITKGAQKKICLSTKTLRDRNQKLDDLLMSLDLEVTSTELCEYLTYMRDILHYPIPNKHCIAGDQLQQTIARVMEKLLVQLLEKLRATKLLIAQSLIGTSINKFLECTILIVGNQLFMKDQVDKMSNCADKLKYQVHRMPKNFN